MQFPCPSFRWLCFAAASAITLIPARAQTLPDGAGKDVVERACSTCHPDTMVMGRNMSAEQWSSEVTKMVGEGAKLTDPEFKQVVDYLAKAYPSGPTATPSPPAPAVQGGRARRGGAAGGSGPAGMQVVDSIAADRGRTVYITECVACHGPRARGASDGVPESQKGSDLVRSVIVLHDRFGKEIGPFLKKGHPMQSGKASASLTEPQIVDLSHFLHQKVADQP